MSQHLGRKAQDPDYGMGEHSIDCDRLGMMDEAELTARLIKTFESPNYNPPRLPAVAMQLMALSQNPDVEFKEIETLLEQDPMLAGEVLSLTRSALYSRTRPVSNLREAIVFLGLSKLREVILQAVMVMRVFRSKTYGECMDRLRDHGRATAYLCGLVAHHTGIGREHAFMCGLLHDIGIAGVLLVLGDTTRGKKAPDLTMLWPSINAVHPKAGSRMVVRWGLPPEVAMAVRAHHQVVIAGTNHKLAANVCLAEALADESGLGFSPNARQQTDDSGLEASGLAAHGLIDKSDAATLARATEALGVDEAKLDAIRAAAQKWAAVQAEAAAPEPALR